MPSAACINDATDLTAGLAGSGQVQTLALAHQPACVIHCQRAPVNLPEQGDIAPLITSPVPALDAEGLNVNAVASETPSPFRASREISACSAGGPSPAAASSAPSSLRSSPVASDS